MRANFGGFRKKVEDQNFLTSVGEEMPPQILADLHSDAQFPLEWEAALIACVATSGRELCEQPTGSKVVSYPEWGF